MPANAGRCPRRADDEAGIVDGKIALGRLDVERHRQRDGRKEHNERQQRESQDATQRVGIEGDDA
jgi:hypothetical protein